MKIIEFGGGNAVGELKAWPLSEREDGDDLGIWKSHIHEWVKLGPAQGRIVVEDKYADWLILSVDNAGLKNLSALSSLSPNDLFGLNARKTKLEDQQLRYIAGLQGLKRIWLSNTQIGNPGLYQIARLKNLKSIDLTRTKIDDSGISCLKSLVHLAEVTLISTEIGDRALADLSLLDGLESLSLAITKITDAGIGHLRTLQKLRHLDLWGTSITSGAFPQLSELSRLETLSLSSTRIDGKGIDRLQELQELYM